MQKTYYNDLIAETANDEELVANVVEEAKGICERRRKYADTVQKDLVQIEREKDTIVPYINDILRKANLIEDSPEKSKIVTLCSEIKSEIDGYAEKATELADRFKNQKIRIVSVGPKSQGKSLFTRLYTRLGENVVAVKEDGRDSDKTGATSVIHHRAGVDPNNPTIKVYFKSKEEVLTRVNEFMRKLKISIKGKEQFDLIEQIANLNGDKDVLKGFNDINEADFALKSGLKAYFVKGVKLDELGDEGKIKELKDLPLYNDMENDEKHYLAVDHIDIYVDMNKAFMNNGIDTGPFEYFEISDTKGSSTDAGGEVADRDIFSAIDKSDAVFSLAQVGTGTKPEDFYNNVLLKHYREDANRLKMLRNRHFVILNLRIDFRDDVSLNKTIDCIETNGVASQVYVGSLKERPVDVDGKTELGTIEPEKFVRSLMLDMLYKIATSTKEYDDNCISQCGRLADEINKKLSLLNDCLLRIKVKCYDIHSILLNKIQEFKDNAIKKLDETFPELDKEAEKITSSENRQPSSEGKRTQRFGDSGNNGDTKDVQNKQVNVTHIVDYGKFYCEKKQKGEAMPTIYNVITGSNAVGNEQRIIGEQKNMEIQDEIKSAVKVLYEKMSQVEVGQLNIKASLLVKGTPLNIGSFIDGVCANYRSQLISTINEGLARQHEIDVKAELKDLFSIVWNELKLNKLFGGFDYAKLSEHANIRLHRIKGIYDEFKYEPMERKQKFFTSYDVLKRYFSAVTEHTQPDTKGPIIEKEKLQDSISAALQECNLPMLMVKRTQQKDDAKFNIKEGLSNCLTDGPVEVELLPLYESRENELGSVGIFSEEDEKKLKSAKEWEEFGVAREGILKHKTITILKVE